MADRALDMSEAVETAAGALEVLADRAIGWLKGGASSGGGSPKFDALDELLAAPGPALPDEKASLIKRMGFSARKASHIGEVRGLSLSAIYARSTLGVPFRAKTMVKAPIWDAAAAVVLARPGQIDRADRATRWILSNFLLLGTQPQVDLFRPVVLWTLIAVELHQSDIYKEFSWRDGLRKHAEAKTKSQRIDDAWTAFILCEILARSSGKTPLPKGYGMSQGQLANCPRFTGVQTANDGPDRLPETIPEDLHPYLLLHS